MATKPTKKKPEAHLIVNGKAVPTAILTEIATALKIGGEVYKAADAVASVIEGEVGAKVLIRDSYATTDEHHVSMRITNCTESGVYIESVSVRLPEIKKEDQALTKDGYLPASFALPASSLKGAHEEPQKVFPKRVPPKEAIDFSIRTKLLDKARFEKRAYLLAEIVFSQLEGQKPESYRVPFRIRWS